jgi:hypothetical protein
VLMFLQHIHTLHLRHIHTHHLNLFTLEVETTPVEGKTPHKQLKLWQGPRKEMSKPTQIW